MFEIKENQRILPDGTRITTYARDIYNCNVLSVEAGTTGYMGGDDLLMAFVPSVPYVTCIWSRTGIIHAASVPFVRSVTWVRTEKSNGNHLFSFRASHFAVCL